MDLVFYQIGLSSVYHPYLVTKQLIGSNALRRKLVKRMPRVCKAVMKTNGGFFEESKIHFD